MNILEHENFSKDIMNRLNGMFVQIEGSTFQNAKEQTIIQTTFIGDILNSISPKVIIETGTHKANFDYFVKLICPEIEIITFGNNAQSQDCVNLLNNEFGKYISFILGDSTKTFSAFTTTKNIDFAWVDGGHSYKICMSDLKNCERLNIPHICVDDYNRLVKKPVTDFVQNSDYKLIKISTDIRGIAYLAKEDK